jgi:hypothetical protein
VCLLLVTACASSRPVQRRAAEPGKAPAPAVAAAGLVVPVGKEAEGVAVDPVTHLAAIGVRDPFGLALIDTRTGRVMRMVPLPGHVRHLAVRGQQVLVPVEDAGRLLVVDLPSGRVSQDVASPGYPHGVSAVGTDGAIIGNERVAQVSLIRSGEVVATATGFPQPGGSAVTKDGIYVVDVSSWRITKLSRALRAGPSAAAGNGPTHAVADSRGNVIVADTRGDAVLVFSPSLVRLQRLPLRGKPYGLAYDGTRDVVYVTLTATNELVALTGPTYKETSRWPTVRQPNTVGVDSSTGTVVVASRTDGTVELIQP